MAFFDALRAELEPDVVSYTALVAALLANQEADRALRVLRTMERSGCRRDRVRPAPRRIRGRVLITGTLDPKCDCTTLGRTSTMSRA